MNKLIVAAIGTAGFALAVGTSYGQGTIDLNNYDSGLGAYVGTTATGAPVGTFVQVLAGPSAGSLAPTFDFVTSGTSVSTFTLTDLNGNGAGTGTFFDVGYGHITTVAPGATAFIQVLMWETAASYAAAQGVDPNYASAVFTELAGTSPAAPNAPVPAPLNIPGSHIILVVPEPGTIALGGLGAAALLLFRRRK